MDVKALSWTINEFVTTLDGLYGYYLDSTLGFLNNERRFAGADTDDSTQIFYGHGTLMIQQTGCLFG